MTGEFRIGLVARPDDQLAVGQHVLVLRRNHCGVDLLQQFIVGEVAAGSLVVVAGDFNDWGAQIKRMLSGFGLYEFDAPRAFTYPARLPLVQLDHVYVRGLEPLGLHVPRGRIWWRMSDHLPLIAEFKL